MDNKTSWLQWAGMVALVLSIVACVWAYSSKQIHSSGPASFGTTSAGNLLIENYIPYVLYNGGINTAKDINITGGFTLGSSGTTQVNQIVGSCAMKADVSIAATTTGYAYCTGVTGVTSSDTVVANFASSTGAIAYADNWIITNAKASTTAGAIDFVLFNLTGTANVPSVVSKIGSTTAIRAAH